VVVDVRFLLGSPDQQLIAEAIDEASRQGVPETSLAVTSAKTALLELRQVVCYLSK
jgi:hypothetical protein